MISQVKLIVFAILAILLIAGSGFAYDAIGDRAVAKYKNDQALLQAKVDKLEQDKYNKVATDFEAVKAEKEIVFKTVTNTIERVVERPVYSTVCVDEEGVEAVNKALEGKL